MGKNFFTDTPTKLHFRRYPNLQDRFFSKKGTRVMARIKYSIIFKSCKKQFITMTEVKHISALKWTIILTSNVKIITLSTIEYHFFCRQIINFIQPYHLSKRISFSLTVWIICFGSLPFYMTSVDQSATVEYKKWVSIPVLPVRNWTISFWIVE